MPTTSASKRRWRLYDFFTRHSPRENAFLKINNNNNYELININSVMLAARVLLQGRSEWKTRARCVRFFMNEKCHHFKQQFYSYTFNIKEALF